MRVLNAEVWNLNIRVFTSNTSWNTFQPSLWMKTCDHTSCMSTSANIIFGDVLERLTAGCERVRTEALLCLLTSFKYESSVFLHSHSQKNLHHLQKPQLSWMIWTRGNPAKFSKDVRSPPVPSMIHPLLSLFFPYRCGGSLFHICLLIQVKRSQIGSVFIF